MPLDRLLQKILDDAEAEVSRREREAARQRGLILDEARTEAEALAARTVEEAKRRATAILERATASGELESRKLLLAAKQHMIRQAVDNAVRTLAELPDEDYRRVLESMLVRAASDLGGGEIEVIVSKDDRERVTQAFLDSVGHHEDLAGRISFQLAAESRETGGGFVLRKGRIESNATFPALARARQEDLGALAGELLFGQD